MFDIRKRKAFQTVGELRALLNHLPPNTPVCICGDTNCFLHEEQDVSVICLDCDDLREHYEEALETLLEQDTPEERDRYLESLWHAFDDVPMDPMTECIETDFLCFPNGTHREDIWHWFDGRHSKGVAYLLNGGQSSAVREESILARFIKEEVPSRLGEIFELSGEQLTEELVQACVKTLDNNADILINYERIDAKLAEVMERCGIDRRCAE